MITHVTRLLPLFLLGLVVCSVLADDPVQENCVAPNGAKVEVGQTIHINPCTFCTCSKGSGEAVCGSIDCPSADCEKPVYVEGQCCPVCQQNRGQNTKDQ
ncbi:cysteine-rich motor neuron 1 protein-like [Crassostrea virginica]